MKKIFLLAFFAIASCGFSPVYENLDNKQLLSSIHVEKIKEREGQLLKNALEKEFYLNGSIKDPKYRLRSIINISFSQLGLLRDETNSINEVSIRVDFKLYDKKTREVISNFSLSRLSSYAVSSLSAYSAEVAEKHATRQAISSIAVAAKNKLLLFIEQYENSSL